MISLDITQEEHVQVIVELNEVCVHQGEAVQIVVQPVDKAFRVVAETVAGPRGRCKH